MVNVARSVPKKTLEPPFIGYAVCTALHRRLGDRFQPSRADQCLILGFGAIGRQVAGMMRQLGFRSANVFVYDTQRARLREARQLGFSIWCRGALGVRFRLVVGCSGRSSFTIGDYVFLEAHTDDDGRRGRAGRARHEARLDQTRSSVRTWIDREF